MEARSPILLPSPTDPRLPAPQASPVAPAAARIAEFERRLAQHAPALAALLRRTSPSPDLREDAVQETLTRAWQARESYDPARPMGPWLATIALRVAAELQRARRRRRDGEEWDEATVEQAVRPVAGGAVGSDTDGGDAAGERGDPLAQLARREECARLREALARLGEVQRRIALRFYRDGASVVQLAAELAMPANTVKSHLRRARLELARMLGGGSGAER